MREFEKINRWFQTPFYPMLFAVYPVIYLAGQNLSIISLFDPLRPIILSILGTLFFLIYFKLVSKTWHRAALLTVLVLILFYTFGHLENQIPALPSSTVAWIWLAIFLGISFLILKFQHAETLTPIMNGVSIGLLFFAVLPIIGLLIAHEQVTLNSENYASLLAEKRNEKMAENGASSTMKSPDIIYIVLDSYEGNDGLRKYYGFDNSDFINALQKRGFYVASHSRSNYLTTTYSLSSVLNLVYINALPYDLFSEMISSLKINHVVDFLHEQGYRYVHFPSGYVLTDDANPDVWASPDLRTKQPSIFQPAVSEFEVLLLQTTLAKMAVQNFPQRDEEAKPQGFSSLNQEFDERRLRIQNVFDHLPDYVSGAQPSFIFAHMILPHNPYLYDAVGNPYEYDGHVELLGDQNDSQNNIRLYIGQLQYANTKVLDTIDHIFENAKTPPVIVIMGDHGHDTFFDFENPTPEGVDLRSSILYAIYFPDQDYQLLYPNITPVNTFRIVFNKFFHTEYPLLPDQSYLHPRRTGNSINSKQQFWLIDPYLDRLPSD